MKTEMELGEANESESTEVQNDFAYSILNQPTAKKAPIRPILIVASVIASASGFSFGYGIANISGALLQLGTDFQLTCEEQELIVSGLLIGGIVGSLVGGYIIDRWERRIGIIVTSCCVILGSIILSASTSYPMLIAGRIIVGVGTTSGVFSASIYLSEIAPPDRRGLLVALIEFMTVIGVLFGYIFNYTFSSTSGGWRYMFAIVIPPVVLQVISLFFLPPSPRFMVKKGYDEKASLVLKKIRSYSNIDTELTDIKSSLATESNYTFLDLFRAKNNMRMRLLIGFGLALFMQATGQVSVLFYASTILRSVGFASESAATLASVSMGLIKVLGAVLAMSLIDQLGRKMFLFMGSTVTIVSLIILALMIHKIPIKFEDICRYPNLTHHWQDNVTSTLSGYNSMAVTAFSSSTDFSSSKSRNLSITDQGNMGIAILQNTSSSPFMGSPEKDGHANEQVSPVLKWLCLCCLLVYVGAFSISFGPVIWLLLSEIFPIGIKGRAVAVIGGFNWTINLLIALTFLSVAESIGLMWVLLIYAILSFVGLIFILSVVPETKGLSLEMISEQLNQGNNITNLCCRPERIKELIPTLVRKRIDGESSIWATGIQYHTQGLENSFAYSTL
ncbi:solute carrier family 2, facilitated glucose transporter member 12 isoform X3 [Scyliorhinus canicula]|nr:solute carrier family 2, facilitated glucose transporter member 12 isoform X3 [Scyliorhinus canicula]XP_038655309.1 solute carrier family 2, facilitated glucose transporter member 12 isoform X3 [Scyliorhinus canicula]XP_038655310.1 solute carrier family 2, facilitated glucose transporter member 12 isoform X3 [Scyliorhinus canicula]